jgi:peptide deformylase
MPKELKLIMPTDPRMLTPLPKFTDDMLKEYNFKDRKELVNNMFDTMYKYGGLGLSANQVGLPFNMFVMGGHPQIENSRKVCCFNPIIIHNSEEEVLMKEGCLTFPFVFLSIKRPRKVVVKFEDEIGALQEGHLDGMFSRIFQHEYDHMLGRLFTQKVGRLKIDMAYEKAQKEVKKIQKRKELNG